MKIAVFGASGFLGRNLTSFLEAAGHVVFPVSRGISDEVIAVDITQYDAFKKLDEIYPDVVVNCASALPDPASLSSPSKLLNFYNVNVVGGANITRWAALKGIKKVINCSSLSVVNKPWPEPLTESANTYPTGRHAAYTTSKLSQEIVMSQLGIEHNIDVIHLRLSALYGPAMKWEGIVAKLITDISAGLPVNLTNASQTYFNFLYVTDVSKLILNIAETDGVNGGIYNTASDEEVSLLQLAETIKQVTHSISEIYNRDDGSQSSRAQIDIAKLLNISANNFTFKRLGEVITELVEEYKGN